MFLISVLLHIIDDFVLQMACLNKLKQKQWWIKECKKENINFEKYQHDYLICLLLHGYEWSIMISLPFMFLDYSSTTLTFMITINALIHSGIDHLKANLLKIDLLTDQFLHIIQILLLYFVMNNF